MDQEILYRQLGRLLSDTPDFGIRGDLDAETNRWLGRVGAIVEVAGDTADVSSFRVSAQSIAGSGLLRTGSIQTILAIANRLYSSLELRVPTTTQGSFVAPGAQFDMHRAMADVLRRANRDVLVVDPYVDEVFLTKYGLLVPQGISIRLLGAAKRRDCGERLLQAQTAWCQQYGVTRPLECRRASGSALHNRHFILDGGQQVWDTGQSVRNFVEHSANSLHRLDGDMALETAEHYEQVWQSASLLA